MVASFFRCGEGQLKVALSVIGSIPVNSGPSVEYVGATSGRPRAADRRPYKVGRWLWRAIRESPLREGIGNCPGGCRGSWLLWNYARPQMQSSANCSAISPSGRPVSWDSLRMRSTVL